MMEQKLRVADAKLLRIQEQNGVCPCPTQSLAHIWSDANGGGGRDGEATTTTACLEESADRLSTWTAGARTR